MVFTELKNNSDLSRPGFDCLLYEGSKKNSGRTVFIFIKKNLSYKIREDLSESDEYKIYYASLLNKYKYNNKQTWQLMKETTAKLKKKSHEQLQKLSKKSPKKKVKL